MGQAPSRQIRRPARVPRKHAPGGLGSPPGPTTGVCHRLAGRGAGEGEEIRRMRGLKFARDLYPEARSQNLKPPGRSAGRRFRGLWFPAIRRSRCGTTIKVRLSALRRPHVLRGETKSTPRARKSRENAEACNEQEFAQGDEQEARADDNEDVAMSTTKTLRRAV
jgi:hypothetical protein